MNILKDRLGNIVRPGDLVVGAALKYRSAELRVGVVEKMTASSVTVMRVTEGYNYKNKAYSYGFRRHTTDPASVVVVRWDLIDKESVYHDILSELREKVMKQ